MVLHSSTAGLAEIAAVLRVQGYCPKGGDVGGPAPALGAGGAERPASAPRIAAGRLGISTKTVEAHRAKVILKTRAENLVELLRMADATGVGRAPASA